MSEDPQTPPPKEVSREPSEHVLAYIEEFIEALDAKKCIICLGDSDKAGINRFCARCEKMLENDSALRFLHETALVIYDFTLALRRKQNLYDIKLNAVPEESSTFFIIWKSMPRKKQGLPVPSTISTEKDGQVYKLSMSGEEKELLEQCLLSYHQCQYMVIVLPDLLEELFLKDPASPLADDGIEEIFFEPRHAACVGHMIHRFTLKDGRQFAVSFTDRQLGWLQIVREWGAYAAERINQVDEIQGVRELGRKRRYSEWARGREAGSGNEPDFVPLRRQPEREDECIDVSYEILGRFQEWQEEMKS